jgi:hypothetical protein
MALLPAGDEILDVVSLGGGERDQRNKPARLRWIVVRDRGFEMLTLRRWLAELPVQPAQQAYR